MTSSTASPISFVGNDLLAHQRAELAARRAACREQIERLTAAQIALSGDTPDPADHGGTARADSSAWSGFSC